MTQDLADHGHEFQAKFHWHIEDVGIRHVHIKPRTPRLNGIVERSHIIDKEEFHQLLSNTDDLDLNQILDEWEVFYNCCRLILLRFDGHREKHL